MKTRSTKSKKSFLNNKSPQNCFVFYKNNFLPVFTENKLKVDRNNRLIVERNKS